MAGGELSCRVRPVSASCAAGKRKNVQLLRFGRYTNICLRDAREWREICCLEGFYKVVERYMIVKKEPACSVGSRLEF